MFDALGSSVALEGTTALVGAPGTEINGIQIGAAYVFNQTGNKWQQTQRVTATNARAGDGFGSSVALDGTSAIIGADQFANDGPGKAYLFDNSTGSWSQQSEIRSANRARYDSFGRSGTIDRSDARFLIGAPGASVNGNAGQGGAYFGKIPAGT